MAIREKVSSKGRKAPVAQETIKKEDLLRDREEKAKKTGEELERSFLQQFGGNIDKVPVVYLVASLIEMATRNRATDIHFDPMDKHLQVRYRIDGMLYDVLPIPEDKRSTVVSRIKVLSDLDITETRHPQDGHISMHVGDKRFDVRVATLPTHQGEKVTLRLLDASGTITRLEDLGLEREDLEKIDDIISRPQGMVLATGPTGSGKTTTLYASLNRINSRTTNIITIEDPVEYQLKGVNQVQVNPDIALTFATTLRGVLRHDPDVILVGEIRDEETARIAIRAAMTGHLVFSTIHTNTASEAVNALRYWNIAPFLINSALLLVIAQRLVRKICPQCEEEYKPDSDLLKGLGLDPTSKIRFKRGRGCQACHQSGYYDRAGVFEMFQLTDSIKKAILNEESVEVITQMAREEGMRTLFEAGVKKVAQGLTTVEELVRVLKV